MNEAEAGLDMGETAARMGTRGRIAELADRDKDFTGADDQGNRLNARELPFRSFTRRVGALRAPKL